MAKTKRRGKGGGRGEKEKPLLTVQGVLRLEKSFITAQNEDAPEVVVKKSEQNEPEVIKLIPGQSEHDLVQYKAGYDTGPSNPNPQNETERVIFKEQKKLEDREEAFAEMKRQSEQERKEREEMFKKKQINWQKLPTLPPGTEKEEDPSPQSSSDDMAKTAETKTFNPDDPNSYELPSHLKNDPAFHNDRPLEFGQTPPVSALPPPKQLETQSPEAKTIEADVVEVEVGDWKGSESQEVPEHLLPKLKPLPCLTESNSKDYRNVSHMALDVAMKMEEERKATARERIIQGEENEEDLDEFVYSLDEITRMNELANKKKEQGPDLVEQNVQEILKQKNNENAKATLDAYWQFVRENPQDFNGWCYLVQHVENLEMIEEVRTSYNAFLPLFPYCFAYWQRYSEMEKKFGNWERALAILHRGLEAIPLSVDLWLSYLQLYRKMYETQEGFQDRFRDQCELAIQSVGLEFRSDAIWDYYLDWEIESSNLKWVTGIYKRLIGIPTKLYNKHWDNFVAHVRNHHPRDILSYEEYDELRKVTCKELELTYRPDPFIEPIKPREVIQPEDKLKAGMKERIVANVVITHEKCEEEVEKRLRFEDKIKRSYFHVKALDLKQLKNWDSYLDFEMSEGKHERIVVLFERCLIPCAQYEQFWAKYARYLEQHHNNVLMSGLNEKEDMQQTESSLKKARFAFGTGLSKVDEIREKRCTWSLRGWKETDKDGNQFMVAEEMPKGKIEKTPKKDTEKVKLANQEDEEHLELSDGEEKENNENKSQETVVLTSAVINAGEGDQQKFQLANQVDEEHLELSDGEEKENIENKSQETVVLTNGAIDAEKGDQQTAIDKEMFDVCKTSTDYMGLEAVRNVFKRACIVHCTKKAMIHMRWAAFEEQCGEYEKAKEILNNLSQGYPLLLECCMQLIDLERRANKLDKAEELYKKLLKKIPQNRKNIKTWISMKLARFQFKVCGKPDNALSTLRSALRKERGDPKLYAQIIDCCYQRHPIDVKGVTAAIELAIKSPNLKNIEKLEFVKRKVEFMHEFGDVKNMRDAYEQMKTFRHLCAADLKLEAKKRRELEREEEKLRELESIKAQVRAEANMKAKIAESEGRLMCTSCQTSMFPDEEGTYEFESSRFGRRKRQLLNNKEGVETEETGDDGVVDLMDLEISADQEEMIKKTLEEKTKYKEVAPTWELNMEEYGYGKRRKVYDPDYEHVENAKFREYERLEGQGYDDDLKDADRDKLKNLNAPGLGSTSADRRKLQAQEEKKLYTESDYIVAPKVPQLLLGPGIGPQKPNNAPGSAQNLTVFELPPEIANPQKSPCVNVPEWFVKEGGELCLSDTSNGMSILRYWPKFLSEKGNHLMFNRMRKYCKWHQKQLQVGGDWKYETRLVAWYGPCDYNYSGLHLEKNLNWAPELLDLLHRLISMTRHDFNSCFLNLYRHGHDMCGWHSDIHPQLGRNPAIASVSLGAVRVFEFRKKNGPPNFIRFPLFPGSLLVMEGATQEDWLHCLPRDVNCKEERVNLTFRTMFSMSKR